MVTKYLLEVISKRRNGISARCLRFLLWMLSNLYGVVLKRRNQKFDAGIGVVKVDASVVSVGNLTTGGTGKTPVIAALAKRLEKIVELAIISRGYGATKGRPNDEAMELALVTNTPHIQNPDRVAAAELAIRQHNAKCLLLDDGFQHRRLFRDLDIVLIDATSPFGYDYMLPRGLLREPVSSLGRADAVIITRTELVTQTKLQSIHHRIRSINEDCLVAESVTQVVGLIDSTGRRQPASALKDQKILAVCAIGNPSNFVSTLKKQQLNVADSIFFSDHHEYSTASIEKIRAKSTNVDAIVCTAKDLVKINATSIGNKPIHALQIEIDFAKGEDGLLQMLQKVLPENATGMAKSSETSNDSNAA